MNSSDVGETYWNELCGDATEYNAFWVGVVALFSQCKSPCNVFLQSDDISLNTGTPDLTQCFQDTVVTWFCGGILVVCSLFLVPIYLTQPKVNSWTQRSWLNATKSVSSNYVKPNINVVHVHVRPYLCVNSCL